MQEKKKAGGSPGNISWAMYCPYCGTGGCFVRFCGSCGSNIECLAPFLEDVTESNEGIEAGLIHKYFKMILQEPSVTCMVPQLQISASRVGGLSSESKGLSSGSSSSVTLERGTSSMGAMSTSVCCDMCFWASYKKISMSTDSCGTTTPSDLFACLSVHQVNLMPCTTCLTGLAEGSVDFQCPGKPYTTLMASCKHHPSTICVVMRIWRCILWTCKDGVGWLHQ
ncbi:uncharacterized protein LOC117544015 isoform X6 [Gymnodraco acuticeps]|uniref:Uncharacterized protein LOC117544015 isoform X6 n=1 Tax=Gymnodraco acuticeps TaxID=8218 RepID=A0A6P8TWD4_GYMAC|nr:uncharacterized protein LOC117544015 isoform X6 [Gymnodraco acuticeps]